MITRNTKLANGEVGHFAALPGGPIQLRHEHGAASSQKNISHVLKTTGSSKAADRPRCRR